jgi:dienelactone hydrolase
MLTTGRIVTAALAVGFLITLTLLAIERRDGPSHLDFELPKNEPGTVYLPGPRRPFFDVVPISPPPLADRPPAVVLIHGYSADRVGMSTLARRLAQNGYAVLAIDLDGHGVNRNPFALGEAERDALDSDIRQAVNYLRDSELVDDSRIVVVGHSMGAGAALTYATEDKTIAGSVMISGGWSLWGQVRPRTALFIFAQHDPEFISAPSMRIAARLASVATIEEGKLYGDFVQGTAVEAVQVPHVDHIQIIGSAAAAQTIIQWIDAISKINRSGPIDLRDPRRTTSTIAFILFLALLFPLGVFGASRTPVWPRHDAISSGLEGLLILGIALIAALPVVALAPLAAFIWLEAANELVTWMAVAGLLMIVWLMLRRPGEIKQARTGFGAMLLMAGLAVALIYAMETPTAVVVHNLALTPERLGAAILCTILLLPFFFSFELLVRCGTPGRSVLLGLAGRVIIVLLLAAGVWLQALPVVAGLMLGLFIILFVAFEILAAAIYRTSGNLTLIALIESAWLAWILAAIMPITLAF